MADAELERTTISVGIGGKKEKFVATGEVITFDGFLQVYRESLMTRMRRNRKTAFFLRLP